MFLQLQAHLGLATVDGDVARSQTVAHLVPQRVQEERLGGQIAELVLGHQHLGDRREDLLELGFHDVAQQHLLRTLGLADPLVVGQIEGDGLHAGARIAGRVDLVNHPDGRLAAAVEVLEPVSDGQLGLQPRQFILEGGQPRRLLGIGDGDEGLEGCLVPEQTVLVGLVGSDGDLHRTVQIHPEHVGFVVVIAQKGRRPRAQEIAQRRVVGQIGGFVQQLRGLVQVIGEEGRIGYCDQAPGLVTANHREEVVEILLPGLDPRPFRGVQIRRVVIGAVGMRRVADERFEVQATIPRSIVDAKIPFGPFALRRGQRVDPLLPARPIGTGLSPEQLVHHACGRHELVQHGPLAGGQVVEVRRHLGSRVSLDAIIQIGHDGLHGRTTSVVPAGTRGQQHDHQHQGGTACQRGQDSHPRSPSSDQKKPTAQAVG